MSETQRQSRVFKVERDNGEIAYTAQFAITGEEARAIEAYGIENFQRLLTSFYHEQLRERALHSTQSAE